MRMGKLGIVAVIAIVAILVVAYLAIIGYSAPVPDFEQNDDGAGGGATGSDTGTSGGDTAATTYSTYATFEVGYNIYPYTGIYSGTQPTEGLEFADISINPSVQPYVSMSEGRVYAPHKLQMDWGGEESGGTGTSTVTVDYYAIVSITGPGGYHSTWQLPTSQYVNPQTTIWHYSFTTGRSFFSTPGEYHASVTFYQYISGLPVIVANGSIDFPAV